jgi:hypothetical protein
MEEIRTREVTWHPKTKKLAQIANEGLEYAFVSKDYRQIHQLVWCKDFMQDAIHGHINKSATHIYGFSYDPKLDPPISMDRTRIMITNWKDAEFGEKVQKRVLPLLHEVEDILGISHTVVEKCAKIPPRYGRSGVWLLDSDKKWMKAPPLISFYTLLIRIGMMRQEGDNLEETLRKFRDGEVTSYYSENRDQDKEQVEGAESGIKKILKHGLTLFNRTMNANYPKVQNAKGKWVSIYTIHDRAGIVAFSRKTTKDLFPHWHRFDER